VVSAVPQVPWRTLAAMITRRFGLLAVALVLLVPLGCGKDGGDDQGVASIDGASNDGGSGDDDSGGGSGSGNPPSNEEFQDAALEYAQCMREHGIDMPDPEFDENGGGGVLMRRPEGADQDEMEAAEEECQPIMEEVAPEGGEIDPERQAEMQDRMVEVAQCMREKGHDMPDPEVDENGRVRFGGGPGGRGEGSEPDEEFEQDMEDCQEQAGMDMPGGQQTNGAGGGV
jgi:hypothetical protein